MSSEVPIPAPKGVPIIGNLLEIEAEVPLNSFERLADTYGTVCLCP
jgi:cytochrome P450/NADPH-cytochrome P450 reductase